MLVKSLVSAESFAQSPQYEPESHGFSPNNGALLNNLKRGWDINNFT